MAFQSRIDTPEVLSNMWKTTFNQDTETLGIGTVTATFNSISYSRRVNTNDPVDKAAFISEAKAKLTASTTQTSQMSPVVTEITTGLNT